MEVEHPGLPLSLSDLQSPDRVDVEKSSSTNHLPHKLEPIQLDAVKKRKRNKSKKTKKAAPQQQQLSKATDDDIQLYFNERKSRLDPVHQETRLDPIPQTDQKYENESKEEPIPVEDDNTSPLSTARTNLQQQQQQTQTTTATTRPLSPALSTTDDQHSVITTASDQSRFDQPEQIGDDPSTEDRREKRKRRKKIKQSLIQTPQDESTLLARELSNDTTNGQQPLIQEDTIDHEERAPSPVTRRQLPELPPDVTQPASEETSPRDREPYQLSCPTDPVFLIDEEDIREGPVTTRGPVTTQGPEISRGKGPLMSGLGVGDQGIHSEETFNGDGAHVVYRQSLETGNFFRVNPKKEGTSTGVEESDGLINATSTSSNTKFVMIIHKAIKRMAQGAHGILAGISLWNSVISLTISTQETNGHVVFLNYYNTFPLVLHSIYLMLLFLILVTVLDKVDVSRISKECTQHLLHSLSEMALLVALVLLVLAFAITVCLAFIDERIFLFEEHPNLWTDVVSSSVNSTSVVSMVTPLLEVDGYVTRGGATSSRLNGWLGMDVTRTIFIIISWLIILCTVSIDRMEDYLCDLENQDENEPTHL